MSELIQDTTASVSADVRAEVFTLALTAENVPDGTDATGAEKHKTVFDVLTKQKEIDEAKAKNIVIIEQTFGYTKPVTVAGFSQLGIDDDELVVIFNAGLKQRASSKSAQLLKALDDEGNPEFQPVEGTFDMQEEINKPLQRRNLSPMDKLVKSLSGVVPGITPEQVAAFLASVQAQQKTA
jgi:hypothetical protein